MFFIGLMSGTSVDAIDAILVDFSQGACGSIVDFISWPIPLSLKKSLMALTQVQPNEINQMLIAEQSLTDCYVKAVDALLQSSKLSHSQIDTIGCHGQTIRHQMVQGQLCTLQIGDMEKLAVRTGISVVGNFRRRDIALGGQGAPLMPLFHQALWSGQQDDFAVLNLGGIANLSVFHKGQCILGFDTGPGNGLIDAWVQRQWQKPYDDKGALARSGVSCPHFLARCLQDDYFLKAPPKSTGRDVLHLQWLEERFPEYQSMRPEDVLASLVDLTARSVVDAVERHLTPNSFVYVAGGGAHNDYLMERLRLISQAYHWNLELPGGISAQQLESYGFAWLAYQHKQGKALNTPSITGASQPCCLGSYSP